MGVDRRGYSLVSALQRGHLLPEKIKRVFILLGWHGPPISTACPGASGKRILYRFS